jgi:hypothetical protein
MNYYSMMNELFNLLMFIFVTKSCYVRVGKTLKNLVKKGDNSQRKRLRISLMTTIILHLGLFSLQN